MTNRKFSHWIAGIALTLAGLMLPVVLHAQSADPPTLVEQLEAQYPLAKMTMQGGCGVANPETALVIQKPGIGALPAKAYTPVCSTHYKEGKVNGPGFWCKQYLETAKQELVTLESSDKVYITKFEVNTNKGEVGASIGYCAQASAYKGDLVFQFPKKFLDTASVPEVEDKIAEVFTPESANRQAQSGTAQPQENSSGSADPQTSVETGQTVEQVVGSLGEPDTKAKGAGTKLIYVWKARKLKVTFMEGKVSDVD